MFDLWSVVDLSHVTVAAVVVDEAFVVVGDDVVAGVVDEVPDLLIV